MPEHYEPTRREHLVMAAYGLGNAIAGACGKIHARRVVVGRWLAALACAFAGWHARGQVLSGAYTLGAAHVQAASEPSGGTGTLAQPFGAAETLPDARYTAADVMATAAAVVALNAPSGAAQDDPMVALVPTLPEYAAPGGPDDGTPPTWLPDGLVPWWLDIVAAAHENGLDSHAWGAIVAIECPWGDPQCGSQAGAKGLAQIIDGTAATIQAQSGIPCQAQAFDGPTSLRCGAFHFAELLRQNADIWRADDQLPALLAAAVSYNAGPGAQPRRAVRDAAQAGGDLCAGVAFAETASYCRRYRDSWNATLAQRAEGAKSGGAQAMVKP